MRTVCMPGQPQQPQPTPQLRADRPAIVVSCTSWTPDEDFSVLLDAVRLLDEAFCKQQQQQQQADEEKKQAAPSSGSTCSRRVLFIITGKGDQKAAYAPKISALNKRMRFARIVTAWLAAADYPRLLGSVDLGVSLHTSSSGLDLPMKVVDMFGCSLPVCAVGFSCLAELVKHNENGKVFADSTQLAAQMQALLSSSSSGSASNGGNGGELQRLRRYWDKHPRRCWSQAWNETAAALFNLAGSNDPDASSTSATAVPTTIMSSEQKSKKKD
jgi:hypothetical protein